MGGDSTTDDGIVNYYPMRYRVVIRWRLFPGYSKRTKGVRKNGCAELIMRHQVDRLR